MEESCQLRTIISLSAPKQELSPQKTTDHHLFGPGFAIVNICRPGLAIVNIFGPGFAIVNLVFLDLV